jgi:hypothetical protein
MLPHWNFELYLPSILTQSKEIKSWQNIKAIYTCIKCKTTGMPIENSVEKFYSSHL